MTDWRKNKAKKPKKQKQTPNLAHPTRVTFVKCPRLSTRCRLTAGVGLAKDGDAPTLALHSDTVPVKGLEHSIRPETTNAGRLLLGTILYSHQANRSHNSPDE